MHKRKQKDNAEFSLGFFYKIHALMVAITYHYEKFSGKGIMV